MDKPLTDGQLALDMAALADLIADAAPQAIGCATATGADDRALSVGSLRRELRRERIARDLCAELNNFTQIEQTLTFIVLRVRELSSAQTVAIRVEHEGEYPYVVHTDHLAASGGGLGAPDCGCPDAGRNLVDCISEVVGSGEYDSSLEFFTPGGSFWCRSITALANSTAGARLLRGGARYSHRCEHESLALIPLSARGVRIGLLELQDRRLAMFDAELIEFLEALAHQIGLAILNARAYSELEASMSQLRVLHGVLPICASCKRIRDDGRWKALEEFITQNSQADFTHGLCPECAKQLYPEVYAQKAAGG